ncbi:MAG: tRNA pseudouridine(55) synthase TruB [bacterium]|nr:tRNA pseudouridine(55) synthase TruB [bacterium]
MARATDTFHGVLLLDKPSGISSHTAVDRVRKIIRQRSIGHAGTLDPAAEGLLILCLGRATKVVRYLTSDEKSYEATITLGRESVTYDAEGVDFDSVANHIPNLDPAGLEPVLDKFRGTFLQKVPAYSAVHIDGKRLYESARRGEEVELPEREVTISELNLLSAKDDSLCIRLTCSKGTYVRSLAHDLGRELGCGGYLSHLRRTSAGRHTLDDAVTLEQVAVLNESDKLADQLLPIEKALDFAAVTISDDSSRFVLHGRKPDPNDVIGIEGAFAPGDRIFLKDRAGSVLAVGTAAFASQQAPDERPGTILSYDRVFN